MSDDTFCSVLYCTGLHRTQSIEYYSVTRDDQITGTSVMPVISCSYMKNSSRADMDPEFHALHSIFIVDPYFIRSHTTSGDFSISSSFIIKQRDEGKRFVFDE